jgi:hypothetical protein
MKAVFDLDCLVIDDPITHTPLIIPHRITPISIYPANS